jgi:hypothetical protein
MCPRINQGYAHRSFKDSTTICNCAHGSLRRCPGEAHPAAAKVLRYCALDFNFLHGYTAKYGTLSCSIPCADGRRGCKCITSWKETHPSFIIALLVISRACGGSLGVAKPRR